MALLPFSTSPEFGGVVAFGLPFLCFAAFGYLLEFLRDGWHWTRGSFFGALYVMVMLGFSVLAPDPVQSFARSVPNLVSFVIFVGLIHELERGSRTTMEVAQLLVLSTVILASYYCLNFTLAVMSSGLGDVLVSRVVGGLAALPWGASNTVAAVIVFGVSCSLLLLQETGNRWYLYSLLFLVFSIGLTFSRAGLFSAVAIITLCFMVLAPRSRAMLAWATCALAVLALLLLSSSFAGEDLELILEDRIQTLADGSGRVEIWSERMDRIMQSPLDQIGYYGSLAVFDGVSSHNFILTTWLETGPLGLFAVFTLLGWPFLRLLKLALSPSNPMRAAALVIVAGLTGLLLNLMVEDPNFTQPYIVCFWLFLAICYGRVEGRSRRRATKTVRALR